MSTLVSSTLTRVQARPRLLRQKGAMSHNQDLRTSPHLPRLQVVQVPPPLLRPTRMPVPPSTPGTTLPLKVRTLSPCPLTRGSTLLHLLSLTLSRTTVPRSAYLAESPEMKVESNASVA